MNRPRSSPWTRAGHDVAVAADLDLALQAQRRRRPPRAARWTVLSTTSELICARPGLLLAPLTRGRGRSARAALARLRRRALVAVGARFRLRLGLASAASGPRARPCRRPRPPPPAGLTSGRCPRRPEHGQSRTAPDDVLLADRPDVRRDPVDEQAGREAVMKGTKTNGSAIMMHALVAVGRDRHQQAREQLRADVEDEQDDQDAAGRLGGQVRDEEELRAARIDLVAGDVRDASSRAAAAYCTMPGQMSSLQVLAQHVEQREEDRQLQRPAAGRSRTG